MDKLQPIQIMIGILMQQPKKQPFCFDKCMDRFDQSITSQQHDCFKMCVKKYSQAGKLLK